MGPLPLLTGSMVLGMLAGRWLEPPAVVMAVSSAACLTVCALLTWKGRRASWWLLLFAALLLGGFLGRRPGSGQPPEVPPFLPDTVVLRGVAQGDMVSRGDSGSFTMRVTSTMGPKGSHGDLRRFLDQLPGGRLSVLVGGGGCGVLEGATVMIRRPKLGSRKGYVNPGVHELPGGRGPPCVIVSGCGQLLVLDEGRPAMATLRSRLSALQNRQLHPAVAGLAEAVTTGRQQGVAREIRRLFTDSGTAHLMAVSGLHLAMVCLLVYWLARRVGSRVPRLAAVLPAQHVAMIAAVLFAWGFALFASGRPPVMRAALMVTAAGMASLSGRSRAQGSGLCLAAAILLVADPRLIVSPSFLLSFSAVMGIFALAPGIRWMLGERWWNDPGEGRMARAGAKLARVIAGSAAVSVAASLSTLPATVGFFGKVPVTGPITNLVAVPVFSVLVLPLAVIHAISALVWEPAGAMLAPVFDGCAWVLMTVVGGGAMVAPVEVPAYLTVAVVLGTSAMLVCLLAKRNLAAGVLAILAVVLVVVPSPVERLLRDRKLDGRMSAVFLDVGQGDATFVRAPDSTSILVDAGPAHPNLGRDAPLPRFLRGWGVDTIDTVIVSHPHADHYGGLSDLLRAGVAIDRLVVGSPPGDPRADPGWSQILGALVDGGTDIELVRGCRDLEGLGLEAEVIHPCSDAMPYDANDGSLVTRFCHEGECILFTGDIGEEIEKLLVEGTPEQLRCRVLKIPHHGSNHSSSLPFLKATSSETAVVSSREGNVHGFPHEEVLGRLGAAGIAVKRIDREGGFMFVGCEAP